MRTNLGPISAFLALLCLPLLWSAQAYAHATLVTADPAPNAMVTAPKMIQLQFSTELAKKFSTLKLTDTDGAPVALTAMASNDPKVLMAMPSAPLSAGLYTVSWTAVSTNDGHRTSGSYSFSVQ